MSTENNETIDEKTIVLQKCETDQIGFSGNSKKSKTNSHKKPKPDIKFQISKTHEYTKKEIVPGVVNYTEVVDGKKVNRKKTIQVERTTSFTWFFKTTKTLEDTPENRRLMEKVEKTSYTSHIDGEFFDEADASVHHGIPVEFLVFRTPEEKVNADNGIPREGWTAKLHSSYVHDYPVE